MENDNRIQALVTANEVAHKTIKELQDKIKSLELQLQAYEVSNKNAYMALDESQKKLEECKKKNREPNYHYTEFDLKHSKEYIEGFEDCKRQILKKLGKARGYLGLFENELKVTIKPE